MAVAPQAKASIHIDPETWPVSSAAGAGATPQGLLQKAADFDLAGRKGAPDRRVQTSHRGGKDTLTPAGCADAMLCGTPAGIGR
jgi:hypothetical protein